MEEVDAGTNNVDEVPPTGNPLVKELRRLRGMRQQPLPTHHKERELEQGGCYEDKIAEGMRQLFANEENKIQKKGDSENDDDNDTGGDDYDDTLGEDERSEYFDSLYRMTTEDISEKEDENAIKEEEGKVEERERQLEFDEERYQTHQNKLDFRTTIFDLLRVRLEGSAAESATLMQAAEKLQTLNLATERLNSKAGAPAAKPNEKSISFSQAFLTPMQMLGVNCERESHLRLPFDTMLDPPLSDEEKKTSSVLFERLVYKSRKIANFEGTDEINETTVRLIADEILLPALEKNPIVTFALESQQRKIVKAGLTIKGPLDYVFYKGSPRVAMGTVETKRSLYTDRNEFQHYEGQLFLQLWALLPQNDGLAPVEENSVPQNIDSVWGVLADATSWHFYVLDSNLRFYSLGVRTIYINPVRTRDETITDLGKLVRVLCWLLRGVDFKLESLRRTQLLNSAQKSIQSEVEEYDAEEHDFAANYESSACSSPGVLY